MNTYTVYGKATVDFTVEVEAFTEDDAISYVESLELEEIMDEYDINNVDIIVSSVDEDGEVDTDDLD